MRRALNSMLCFLLAVLCFSGNLPFVLAQKGGSGLQISPTRHELSIAPGEVSDIKISVKNVTPGDIIAKAFVNDFDSDNDTGQPKLLIDQKEPTANSIKKFLKGLGDLELKSGETKEVKLSLDIPINTSPGAYYGAIRYAAIPKELAADSSKREVSLTASVATLVLLTVPGEVRESARFDKLALEPSGITGILFTKPPKKAAVQLTNTGNGFIKPFGRVTIFKNGQNVYSYELNNVIPRGNILPNSTRTYRDEIKNISNFGQYKVVANVSYSEGGEVLSQTKSFWIVPLWILIILLLTILGALVGLYLLAKRIIDAKKSSPKRK